ncbi:maestro heat-like repeat-containing protein family member 7 [Ahaetulla prasina]|uniref:maestro heat-like repeat-containing protein family member 7 n=1 Tax=Ahaetulla prasina TaxID=499056 RepID=UPI0026493ECE|nr:maestro heat-like repeat-containing protein family member 7 [Ahaetulla prasina]
MVPLLDNIVSEILGQYGTMNKDEGLKTAFMRSIIMITKAVAYSKRQDIYLPRKQELVMNIIEAIEEHPARALSVVILHKAIVTITCMSRMKPPLNSEMRAKVASKSIEKVFSLPPLKMTTLQASSPAQSTQTQVSSPDGAKPYEIHLETRMCRMKPPLNSEMRAKVASKSIEKVFSLPPLKMTTLQASSPAQSTQTQDFYHQTVNACNTMLTSLLSEAPNLDALQDILMHTNPWIESSKSHEKKRALKSTRHLLKFVSENVNFDITAEFFLLGRLVALLALHIGDTSKEVGQTSAEAAYYLHHLLMSKMAKEMDQKPKNKKGNIVRWLREDFFISGPTIFYNNISKMAKAFGEHLGPSQSTEVIFKALEVLTHQDKNMSYTAGLMLSSFLEECGMEMEELPMIVKEMYTSLPNILDPATKGECLKAVCHLAAKRVNGVVDILLECSVACDGSARELWKALAEDPYANMKIMKPLLKRLQDEDPSTEAVGRRNSKSPMPIAATNALCFLLSLPNAANTLQHKFPNLLIALVTQLYFLLGASKSGSRRSSRVTEVSEQINLLGNTVQTIKNLIMCAGYEEEFNDLEMLGCWDMLVTPDSFFEGIFHLIRNLFSLSKVELKTFFRQANTYLRRPDLREKTIGMVFFSELLYHPEVGNFFIMQDILHVLMEWMTEPYALIQFFSIRGLGYLLQRPFEKKMLEPFLTPLVNCAAHQNKSVAKEALRTLNFLFRHLSITTHGGRADDIELKNVSIRIYDLLLKGVKDLPNSDVIKGL